MRINKMDRALYLLNKFLFQSRHRELAGKLELQTASGELFIPISFKIANIESDTFTPSGDNEFVAPCAPTPNEFVMVESVSNTGADQAQYPFKVRISWAINSYKVLIWKVSGFVAE
jgi:hypothetical protein